MGAGLRYRPLPGPGRAAHRAIGADEKPAVRLVTDCRLGAWGPV